MAWHTLMAEMPAMADAAKYRTLYYDFVFEGKTPGPQAATTGSKASSKASAPVRKREQLAELVNRDREDPVKAAMRAESLARREARIAAAQAG